MFQTVTWQEEGCEQVATSIIDATPGLKLVSLRHSIHFGRQDYIRSHAQHIISDARIYMDSCITNLLLAWKTERVKEIVENMSYWARRYDKLLLTAE